MTQIMVKADCPAEKGTPPEEMTFVDKVSKLLQVFCLWVLFTQMANLMQPVPVLALEIPVVIMEGSGDFIHALEASGDSPGNFSHEKLPEDPKWLCRTMRKIRKSMRITRKRVWRQHKRGKILVKNYLTLIEFKLFIISFV